MTEIGLKFHIPQRTSFEEFEQVTTAVIEELGHILNPINELSDEEARKMSKVVDHTFTVPILGVVDGVAHIIVCTATEQRIFLGRH